ncbi:MAG: UDP-N-acetylmuramoyl-L-alanyl-D-glutamate--2,6-diaminopimelate ligase [Chitinophagales bacterium]
MLLGDLLKGLEYQVIQGSTGVDITGIEYDSRQVQAGSAFVCIPGFKTDGHIYAPQAVANGARAIIVERAIEAPAECALIKVENARVILPTLAARFNGYPSRELRVIGVTGTNGKTTTTHLIRAILEEAGHRVGLIGTLYSSWNGKQESIAHTTPESVELEKFMRKVRDEGGEYVVMEVSSHALELDRAKEINFEVGIFTNLTRDHLDLHQTMENYRAAKEKLFKVLHQDKKSFAIINADDDYAEFFITASNAEVVTYGTGKTAEVRAADAIITAKGSSFQVVYPYGKMAVNLKLAGMFSIYNALAAVAFAVREGIEAEIITRALEKVEGVPGRFESVDEGQDYSVIVDYAHTPDGLENILKTGRQIARRRVITVFGCGGDRDRTKRPIMGKIAAELSDFALVTSDNPRSEDPLAIIDEILVGVRTVPEVHYAVVPDRKEAIHHAIQLAGKDDLVIIAGKGHEDYQIIKDKIIHFDDREIARDCIRKKLENG